MLPDDPARLQADARLDALLRGAPARRRRGDGHLRRRAAPLPAARRRRGAGGHRTGHAGSPQARQERRPRCPERRARRLRRPAHRHAEEPRRHDRVPARAQGLPQDGRGRPPRRLADDPQHHRLRARRVAGDAAPDDPHAAHPDAGRLAAGPDGLPQRGFRLPDRAHARWLGATSSCTTRSPISTP